MTNKAQRVTIKILFQTKFNNIKMIINAHFYLYNIKSRNQILMAQKIIKNALKKIIKNCSKTDLNKKI